MNSLEVITFGEAMAMFIANHPGPLHTINQFTLELAGAETNVAIGLARLGLRVGWVSKVDLACLEIARGIPVRCICLADRK